MNQPQSHRATEFEHINNLTQRIIGAAIEGIARSVRGFSINFNTQLLKNGILRRAL